MSLYSRLKVWALNETIKSSDLNAEFNNIISNAIPASFTGYEGTVTQMRLQTDPGSQGSENQASSLAGEIERLRFVINRALGGTYWYDNPNTSLQALNSLVNTSIVVSQNRIQAGRVNGDNQPMYLVPDTGSNSTVRLKATSTNLTAYIKGVLVTIAADLTATLSGPSSFTTLVNDATLTAQVSSQTQGENGTVITVDTPTGSAPTVGSYQAFKVVHSATAEYFFGRYASATQIDKCQRGNFFNASDTSIRREGIADNDVITLCRAAYMFLTNVSNTPALAVTYNEPTVSYVAPAAPSAGDWWLDLSSSGGIWRVFSGGIFIDGVGTYLGTAVVDGSNVVAARAKSFDRGFSNLNTIALELADTATIQTVGQGSRISVYGNSYEYIRTTVKWANSAQLDSGVTIGNSSTYYLYISDTGKPFISDQQPYDSRGSLLGFYHPFKPWRAVGFFTTDSSANFLAPFNYDYLAISYQQIDKSRLVPDPISLLSTQNPLDGTTTNKLVLTTSYQDVPALMAGTTTLVLNNRPVMMTINIFALNSGGSTHVVTIQVLRGSTVLRTYTVTLSANGSVGDSQMICDTFLDVGGSGSTIYKLQAKKTGSDVVEVYTVSPTPAQSPTPGNATYSKRISESTAPYGIQCLEAIEL